MKDNLTEAEAQIIIETFIKCYFTSLFVKQGLTADEAVDQAETVMGRLHI